MANQISKLSKFIIDNFKADQLVNTVIFKDSNVIDFENQNIYPLVSLRLVKSKKDIDMITISVDFEVFCQRDFIPKADTSKILENTNYIDNINICDAIANDFLMRIIKSHNDLHVNCEVYSDVDYFSKEERNGLDGVKFSVDFTMHQNDV